MLLVNPLSSLLEPAFLPLFHLFQSQAGFSLLAAIMGTRKLRPKLSYLSNSVEEPVLFLNASAKASGSLPLIWI